MRYIIFSYKRSITVRLPIPVWVILRIFDKLMLKGITLRRLQQYPRCSLKQKVSTANFNGLMIVFDLCFVWILFIPLKQRNTHKRECLFEG